MKFSELAYLLTSPLLFAYALTEPEDGILQISPTTECADGADSWIVQPFLVGTNFTVSSSYEYQWIGNSTIEILESGFSNETAWSANLPAECDIDFTLTISHQCLDGQIIDVFIPVEIEAQADIPAVLDPSLDEEEDVVFVFDPFVIASGDTDTSEIVDTLVLGDVPAGALVSLIDSSLSLQKSADGTIYTISAGPAGMADQSVSSFLAPVEQCDSDFVMVVTARSIEANGGDQEWSLPSNSSIRLASVVDSPRLSASLAWTTEDTANTVFLTPKHGDDTDDSEKLTVIAVRDVSEALSFQFDDAVVSLGSSSDVAFEFAPLEGDHFVPGKTLTNGEYRPPPNCDVDFTVSFTVTNLESNGGDTTSSSRTAAVLLTADAEGVTLALAQQTVSSIEDRSISVSASPTSQSGWDTDASEAVRFLIAMSQTSLRLSFASIAKTTSSATSSVYTIDAGADSGFATDDDVPGLQVSAAVECDVDFTVSMRFSTVERNGGSTYHSDWVSLGVAVVAVADEPEAIWVTASKTTEDMASSMSFVPNESSDTDKSQMMRRVIFSFLGDSTGPSLGLGSSALASVQQSDLANDISYHTLVPAVTEAFSPWTTVEDVLVTPVAHSDVDFIVTARIFTIEENAGSTSSISSTVSVLVRSAIDEPSVAVAATAATEDVMVAVVGTPEWGDDTDASECLTRLLVTSSMPAIYPGASTASTSFTLDANVTHSGGFTSAQTVPGLSVQAAGNSDVDFVLTAVAESVESNNGDSAFSGDATAGVVVHGMTDEPVLRVVSKAIRYDSDNAIPLVLTPSLVDTDGSEVLRKVVFSGVPEGTSFVAPSFVDLTKSPSLGVYTMSSSTGFGNRLRVSGLSVMPPDNLDAEFYLTSRVLAVDTDDVAVSSTSVLITVFPTPEPWSTILTTTVVALVSEMPTSEALAVYQSNLASYFDVPAERVEGVDAQQINYGSVRRKLHMTSARLDSGVNSHRVRSLQEVSFYVRYEANVYVPGDDAASLAARFNLASTSDLSNALGVAVVEHSGEITDANECEEGHHDCSMNALCYDEEGGYRCECLNGYSGDGFLCEESSDEDAGEYIVVVTILAILASLIALIIGLVIWTRCILRSLVVAGYRSDENSGLMAKLAGMWVRFLENQRPPPEPEQEEKLDSECVVALTDGSSICRIYINEKDTLADIRQVVSAAYQGRDPVAFEADGSIYPIRHVFSKLLWKNDVPYRLHFASTPTPSAAAIPSPADSARLSASSPAPSGTPQPNSGTAKQAAARVRAQPSLTHVGGSMLLGEEGVVSSLASIPSTRLTHTHIEGLTRALVVQIDKAITEGSFALAVTMVKRALESLDLPKPLPSPLSPLTPLSPATGHASPLNPPHTPHTPHTPPVRRQLSYDGPNIPEGNTVASVDDTMYEWGVDEALPKVDRVVLFSSTLVRIVEKTTQAAEVVAACHLRCQRLSSRLAAISAAFDRLCNSYFQYQDLFLEHPSLRHETDTILHGLRVLLPIAVESCMLTEVWHRAVATPNRAFVLETLLAFMRARGGASVEELFGRLSEKCVEAAAMFPKELGLEVAANSSSFVWNAEDCVEQETDAAALRSFLDSLVRELVEDCPKQLAAMVSSHSAEFSSLVGLTNQQLTDFVNRLSAIKQHSNLGTALLEASQNNVVMQDLVPLTAALLARAPLHTEVVNFKELNVERRIGEGRFGVVYRAEYRRGECVALKVLRPDSAGLERAQAFVDEVREKLLLRSPRLVHLLGVVPTHPLSLVYEWADHGNLRTFLVQTRRSSAAGGTPVTFDLLQRLAIDSASAVLVLHKQSPPMPHGALHTKNLLVFHGCVVKLGDFGVRYHPESILEDPHATWLDVADELARVAPESYQVSNLGSSESRPSAPPTPLAPTLAMDTYALGTVLWELFCSQETSKWQESDPTAIERTWDVQTVVSAAEDESLKGNETLRGSLLGGLTAPRRADAYDIPPPFPPETGSSSALQDKIRNAGWRPLIPPSVHPRLAQLIMECWYADPGLRPSVATVLSTIVSLKEEDPARAAERIETLARYRNLLRLSLQSSSIGTMRAAEIDRMELQEGITPEIRTQQLHLLGATSEQWLALRGASDSTELKDWLKEHGAEKWIENFAKAGVTTIRPFSMHDLQQTIGVTDAAIAGRLCRLSQYRTRPMSATSSVDSVALTESAADTDIAGANRKGAATTDGLAAAGHVNRSVGFAVHDLLSSPATDPTKKETGDSLEDTPGKDIRADGGSKPKSSKKNVLGDTQGSKAALHDLLENDSVNIIDLRGSVLVTSSPNLSKKKKRSRKSPAASKHQL